MSSLNRRGTARSFFATEKGSNFRLELQSESVALFEVGKGTTRLLAKGNAIYSATNTLLVVRRDSLLRVTLNGRVVLETMKAPGVTNRVRIAGSTGQIRLLEEPRFQPTDRIYLADDFMTTPEAPSHWSGMKGTWHVTGAGRPEDAADPFKYTGFAPGEALSLNGDSRWFWNDYQTDVSARVLNGKAGMGIVFAYRGPRDFYCFSWDSRSSPAGGAGKMRLWRRIGKRTLLLAERVATARTGQWYRLSVSTFGTRIVAYLDENSVLQANSSQLTGGQIGLYAAGDPGAEFDDVAVQSTASTALLPRRAGGSDAAWQQRTFATDPFMEAWGSASADWEQEAGGGFKTYQHRGTFFQSLDIRVAASLLTPSGAPRVQEISLLEPEGGADTGYRLQLEAAKAMLRRKGKLLASAALPADTDLHIKIRGGSVQVWGDGGKLLDYEDTHPAPGGRVGLSFRSRITPFEISNAVQVSSPNFMEYRFDSAPVDWRIESGMWQSTTRWACVPNWNFYGGRGEPLATVWNKRGFGGDQWIEAFVAPSEGTSDFMHFAFPVNLNLTFGASDETLRSGYSLVYRVHDQSTILYRSGKQVAVSHEMVLPDWRSDAMFVYHRLAQTWQQLQILKQGGRIRIWVEVPGPPDQGVARRQLIDYTDPAPLMGDRMALWSWGLNGMSVAKMRVSASRIHPPYADSSLSATPAAHAPGKVSLQRRVNTINGGPFRTNLMNSGTSIPAMPVLRFDYDCSPDTTLALYAVAGGQLFRADFLGRIRGDGDAVPIGAIRQTRSPNGLRHAEFPLRQALRAFFPSGDLPRVEELFLGNLSTLPEQIGGLAANPKGAFFAWRWAPSAPTTGSASLFKLAATPGKDLPHGDIRISLANDAIDPAHYAVAINGSTLKWGVPGLTWSFTQHEIRVAPAQAGFSFQDGEKVQLTISRENAPPAFAHQWIMRTTTDKTPPAPPQVVTARGPDRVETFENSTGGWERLGGGQGATLWRDDSTAAMGNSSLRLYHREVAGPFGALVGGRPIDTRRFPLLTFSYRITPAVQLSLVCEINGRWYEIGFTDTDHTFPVLGTIGKVQTDGRWHEAEIDLRTATSSMVISRLFFADTGITNNLQDISWHVDNFRFVPALPASGGNVLSWSADDLSGIEGTSWVIDNAPDTLPDEVMEPDNSVPVVAGATYLHVRAKDKAGNWGMPAHFRFALMAIADSSAPVAIQSVTPAATPLTSPAIRVQLKGAERIDIDSVRMRVKQGRDWKEYSLMDSVGGSPALTWSSREGVLQWRDAALTAAGGYQPYELQVELKISDLTGKPVIDEQWQCRVDPSLEKSPPPAPFVSYIPANRLSRHDFEAAIPAEVGIRRSAWVLPDKDTSATGQSSARVVNLKATDFFSAFLRKTPYSVDRYPHLSFDYRFETPNDTMMTRQRYNIWGYSSSWDRSAYNLNLVAIVNGEMQILSFVGGPNASETFKANTIGAVDNAKADGEWHQASIDLESPLRKRYPTAPRFIADYVGTWATGPRGYDNPQGASLWLDNVTFFSTVATSAAFEWSSPDDSNGIRGYSYLLDQKPDTMPAEKIVASNTQCEFKDLKPGTWYFHLRALDGAGNWGLATHTSFELTASTGRVPKTSKP